MVEILVDVGKARAITVVGRVAAELGIRVLLGAYVQHNRALPVFQGPHGLQGNRAGQALADEAGIRSFVNDDAADELGRILIELDAAVVARAHLLAAI